MRPAATSSPDLFGRQVLFVLSNSVHLRRDNSQSSKLQLRRRFKYCRSLPCIGGFVVQVKTRSQHPVRRHEIPCSFLRRKRHSRSIGRGKRQRSCSSRRNSRRAGEAAGCGPRVRAAGVRSFDLRQKSGYPFDMIQTHHFFPDCGRVVPTAICAVQWTAGIVVEPARFATSDPANERTQANGGRKVTRCVSEAKHSIFVPR